MECLWDPSWKHLEGLAWSPRASNSPRVNNQPACFSNTQTLSRRLPPRARRVGRNPRTPPPPDIQTQAQEKQTRGGQSAEEEAVVRAASRPHTAALLFNSVQMEEAVCTDFRLPALPLLSSGRENKRVSPEILFAPFHTVI